MKRIVLITAAPFPVGNVSTLRFTSYLNSLTARNERCKVIVYIPSTIGDAQQSRRGEHNGVEYEYSCKPHWSKGQHKIAKLFIAFVSVLKSVAVLVKSRPKSVILYGDNSMAVTLLYKLVCVLMSVELIGDRSELMSVRQRGSSLLSRVYIAKQRLYNKMIVMTRGIESFYESIYKKSKRKTFFLPMTIDCNRFDGVVGRDCGFEYIAVVFGTHNRDGLKETMLSYKRYCQKGGVRKLMLIGDFENLKDREPILRIIESGESWVESVIFKGRVNNSEVPALLKGAGCLLTTANEYISGGFPTKLGEYMLSGAPIVATNAGEIPLYLSDRVEAMLCEVGDVESISDSLLYLEKNANFAKQMTASAQKMAKDIFNADSYADGLLEFVTHTRRK